MAKIRKSIPTNIKLSLINESGMKCANPGCVNYTVHIHHIKMWAVYETHDQAHMIAICPVCHSQVHNGELIIDDETLYRWKSLSRTVSKRSQLYVEPGIFPRILLGTIAVAGNNELLIFDLSPNNRLGFHIVDDDIFLLNLKLKDLRGKEIIRVIENVVKYKTDRPIVYSCRTGKIRVTAPVSSAFVPDWALCSIRSVEPNYASDGQIVLLDIEVLEPGLVQVQGIWALDRYAIVITNERLAVARPNSLNPTQIIGMGKDTVIVHTGPIDKSCFNIQ